jgi:hypothetical protein
MNSDVKVFPANSHIKRNLPPVEMSRCTNKIGIVRVHRSKWPGWRLHFPKWATMVTFDENKSQWSKSFGYFWYS